MRVLKCTGWLRLSILSTWHFTPLERNRLFDLFSCLHAIRCYDIPAIYTSLLQRPWRKIIDIKSYLHGIWYTLRTSDGCWLMIILKYYIIIINYGKYGQVLGVLGFVIADKACSGIHYAVRELSIWFLNAKLSHIWYLERLTKSKQCLNG